MFNLLPQQEKNGLVRDFRLRFATVGLVLFASLGAVALVALVPSFFLLRDQISSAQKNSGALNQEIELASKDKISDTLLLASKKVFALTATSSTPYTYELVSDIVRNMTNNVRIMGIRVSFDKTGKRDITIVGEATDRDSLLAFANILERGNDFKEVTVPVSNFADALDLKFSILVKVK